MRRLAVLLAGAAAALGASADARACSCIAWGEPREDLRRADGAFVGVYLRRRPLPRTSQGIGSTDPFAYRFRVERVVKGAIRTRTIEVVSVRDGASCGLEVRPRQRISLLLRRERGRWHASLCDQRPAAFFRGVRATRRPATVSC